MGNESLSCSSSGKLWPTVRATRNNLVPFPSWKSIDYNVSNPPIGSPTQLCACYDFCDNNWISASVAPKFLVHTFARFMRICQTQKQYTRALLGFWDCNPPPNGKETWLSSCRIITCLNVISLDALWWQRRHFATSLLWYQNLGMSTCRNSSVLRNGRFQRWLFVGMGVERFPNWLENSLGWPYGDSWLYRVLWEPDCTEG